MKKLAALRMYQTKNKRKSSLKSQINSEVNLHQVVKSKPKIDNFVLQNPEFMNKR